MGGAEQTTQHQSRHADRYPSVVRCGQSQQLRMLVYWLFWDRRVVANSCAGLRALNCVCLLAIFAEFGLAVSCFCTLPADTLFRLIAREVAIECDMECCGLCRDMAACMFCCGGVCMLVWVCPRTP